MLYCKIETMPSIFGEEAKTCTFLYFTDVTGLLLPVFIAYIAGKLISKVKLPSILGWLIVGMMLGPRALNLLSNSMLDSVWFNAAESIFECIFGFMIGTELIWEKLKKSGPQILITTLTEFLETFLVVSLIFGMLFWLADVPIYLATLFGGMALATAPAPSLSVVHDI